MQGYVFLFHVAPETFDEDVVNPAALAIHTNLDRVVLENIGEGFASELTTLVTGEDVGRGIFCAGIGHRHNEKICHYANRYPMRQYLARGPVDDSHQTHEAAPHRNIRQIRRQDLIGPIDHYSRFADQPQSLPMQGCRAANSLRLTSTRDAARPGAASAPDSTPRPRERLAIDIGAR